MYDLLVSIYKLLKQLPYILPLFLLPYVLFLKVQTYLRKDSLNNRRNALTETKPQLDQHPPIIIGYFHPYSSAFGGGERVLFTMIHALQRSHPYAVHAIYTGDDTPKDELVRLVKIKFNLDINIDTIYLVNLKTRKWVEAGRYPRFTMLLQSLGSMVLGWEAMQKLIPDVFLDTMGYSFTYPIVRLIAGTKVASYVHYPTISSDMLSSVASRDSEVVNNSSSIANSSILSAIKIYYYKLFAKLYSIVGKNSELVIVNSSWTKGHIDDLWEMNSKIIYPPCDTKHLSQTEIKPRQPYLISVAQFSSYIIRPEKNHLLQINVIIELFNLYPQYKGKWGIKNNRSPIQLHMIGSVRNEGDQNRVDKLNDVINSNGLNAFVHVHVNLTFDELKDWMGQGLIGLHTMENEHFGIGVVEYLASGMIPLAHDSAGPKMDIVKKEECYGFLAKTAKEYAEHIHTILQTYDSDPDKVKNLQEKNQKSSNRFSNTTFEEEFIKSFGEFIGN